MGSVRDACVDSSESAEAQTRLRQPKQNGQGAFESLLRRAAAALAVSSDVLHARTAEAARGNRGDEKYAISIERNRGGGGSGSGGAESRQDTEGTENQCAERRVLLHRLTSR